MAALRLSALLDIELDDNMIAILLDGKKQEFKPQASMTGKRFLGAVLSEQDVCPENKEWLAGSVFPRISGEAEKLHHFLGLDI